MGDLTIGKGKLLLKPSGNTAWKDLGNCPDFKVTPSIETKEHFSSRSGLQKKDKEIVVKQEMAASFTLDEPSMATLDMFVMGSGVDSTTSQTAGTVADGSITAPALDEWLEVGHVNIDAASVVVTDDPMTETYVEGTDYEIDYGKGLFRALTEGVITASQALLIDYTYPDATVDKVFTGLVSKMEGDLLFVGNPPVGAKLDVVGFGSLKPTGDLSLIGEEWMQYGFEFEYLESASYTGLMEVHKRGVV